MTTDEETSGIRDILLGRSDTDDIDYQYYKAPCYSMSWDKKRVCWAVKVDGARVMELTAADLPNDVEVGSYEFVDHILRILREGGVEGLRTHIEELKCAG